MTKDEAIKLMIEKLKPCVFGQWREAVDMAIEALKNSEIPNNSDNVLSAEPIIHCKDCKHWEGHVGTIYDGLGKCSFHEGELVKSEGSCYLAERKTDE